VASGGWTFSSSTDDGEVFQQAIDRLAGRGGTITVKPARYIFDHKTVELRSEKVKITGEQGERDNTIIDARIKGGLWGAAFRLRANDLTITRLTITGANSHPEGENAKNGRSEPVDKLR
jgi:hypothetical protein